MRGQSLAGNHGDIPWLTFSQMTSKSSIVRAKKKLEILKKKEIYVPNEINWKRLGHVGLVDDMTSYLVKTFVHNGTSITCGGWSWLFRIQEPMYQELC